jgi:hypothetical protein
MSLTIVVVWMAAKLTIKIRETSCSVPVSSPSAASINHRIKSAYDETITSWITGLSTLSAAFLRSSIIGVMYLEHTLSDDRRPQKNFAISLQLLRQYK